ncbi:MAG: PEP-utilizing enzyme [bacterium]|nr:PEP-utilizing enzyme [bacterium]
MELITPQKGFKPYKQEGKTGAYQSMLWALSVARSRLSYIPVSWGEFFGYFDKQNYLGVVWDENGFEKVTRTVLDIAKEDMPSEWQAVWERADKELTKEAKSLAESDMSQFSLDELRVKYDRLFELDQKMWGVSIFIDTFDPGFDQARMKEIADEHHLNEMEVQTLVSPTTPAFVTEWDMALQDVEKGMFTHEDLRHHFFWYATDYVTFGEVTDDFIEKEIQKKYNVGFISLEPEQKEILKRHNLTKNPLQFFKTLTTWRDERKRLNYTGLYGLLKILREVLSRQGIDPILVNALLPHQASDLFEGKMSEVTLRKQFNEGILLHVTSGGELSFYFGEQARQSWKAIEESLQSTDETEVRGTVASKGKATGRVRLVPHITNQNASLMEKGDILVTSMTRPEFLPLMHLAGAIVTNEGGVTSHAAIVSRELRKPCIIGTKNATRVLHDGDLVEVDAEKGIVRIIERK